MFALTSTGGLRLYRGNGNSGFIDSGTQPGGGWNGFNVILGVGDFTGDGKADALGRTTGGYLLVYRGNGAGSFADNGTVIGNGYGGFTAMAAAADFSGDGKLDILGRSCASLSMYRGYGLGGLKDNGQPFGGDWGRVTDLMAPGDFTGDGKPDLLARRAAEGTLRVHRATATAGLPRAAR